MKKTNLKLFLIAAFVLVGFFSLYFFSTEVLAQDTNLVPCGTIRDANNNITNPCGFNDIMTLINTVVKFIFINLALPIAAIMFAYAGFELVTSGGETSKRERAKRIFINVAIGLIVVAAAFLIVQTVLKIAGYDTGNGWNWFGF
ncbi:MAG: pilin [Candidatus Paceibacterota bacterium]